MSTAGEPQRASPPGAREAEARSKTAQGPRPWGRAVAWLAFLGPFFFLTYGFANWVTAQRTGVPSLAYAWERAIPFWPWTILPYWSIDLLYGISLFVCATRAELDAHARRLLTAQLVAIACFIAFPLRFSFDRPPADGWAGALFALLGSFDLPFNQLPSLHIALGVILWSLFAVRLRGVARILLDVWFILIGVSALTTYQHHFIDVPTGLALGWLCVWLWPLPATGLGAPAHAWRRAADPARHRLAWAYAAGSLVLACGGVVLGGTALWLLWPALALAFVALAYAGLGPAVFQKSAAGRLSLAARWLLAPYLAGAWINSRWWTRRAPQPVPVADGVWLGRSPGRRDLAGGRFAGIVDLTAEMSLPPAPPARAVVPVLDLTVPDAASLAAAAGEIERLRRAGPVLVCCALGYSRSACTIAAWLVRTGRAATPHDAVARVRAARRDVRLHHAHLAALAAMTAPSPTHRPSP